MSGNDFGFTAQHQAGDAAPKGNVQYQDKVAGVQLKGNTITGIAISGTHAVILGAGTVNGIAVTFRVDVDDLGEPGSSDTFRISWPGYSSPGLTLISGNVQIHK